MNIQADLVHRILTKRRMDARRIKLRRQESGESMHVQRKVPGVYACLRQPTGHIYDDKHVYGYGVATISRLLKIIGLFCKRALCKRRYSAKGT